MGEQPDPRFLDGAEGVVLTDTREMALTVAFNWNGAVDMYGQIERSEAIRMLRALADEMERSGG